LGRGSLKLSYALLELDPMLLESLFGFCGLLFEFAAFPREHGLCFRRYSLFNLGALPREHGLCFRHYSLFNLGALPRELCLCFRRYSLFNLGALPREDRFGFSRRSLFDLFPFGDKSMLDFLQVSHECSLGFTHIALQSFNLTRGPQRSEFGGPDCLTVLAAPCIDLIHKGTILSPLALQLALESVIGFAPLFESRLCKVRAHPGFLLGARFGGIQLTLQARVRLAPFCKTDLCCFRAAALG
jgi:hypothetical protein